MQLFDRSRRTVRLTDAGKSLLSEGRHLLKSSAVAVQLARDVQAGTCGLLRLGFTGSAGYRIVPLLLRQFRGLYPHVSLELTELTSREQLNQLQNRLLDVGLVRSVSGSGELSSMVVWREPLIVALPAGNPLTSNSQVVVSDLRNEPFILFPRWQGPDLYDMIMSICQKQGFLPQVVQEAVQMPTIIGMVGAGFGCAIVPASVQDFQFRGVTYRKISDEMPHSTMMAVWNESNQKPTRDRFLEVARLPLSTELV